MKPPTVGVLWRKLLELQCRIGSIELTGDVNSGPGSGTQPATIANDAVTNAKLANMAADTIKGRADGAGTGDPQDLTANQVSTILDTATDPFLRTSAFGLTDAGNTGIALTLDFLSKKFGRFECTATGSFTFTLNNPSDGGVYYITVHTGAGGFTAAWPLSVLWPSGVAPVLTTAASKTDLFVLVWNNSAGKYYGSFNQNYNA